ncbi:MAG: ribonuclease III domain-containing protein [Promethearchaeota archaeon]
MFESIKDKLRDFQEFIDYNFQNEALLAQALTTPQLGNEIGTPNYEFLETLGDAVIKIIFILKLYRKGIKDPGIITKIKASLESDKNLQKVAQKMNLHEYIFKADKQRVKGTRILADIYEAICGAIFIDSDNNLNIVEQKIIDPFYENLDIKSGNLILSKKNELLEFLQEKFKTNIYISLEYEKGGLEHDPTWIAKNPKILEKDIQKELFKLPKGFKSKKFTNKKDAEKDIYFKILDYLKNEES